MGTKQSRQVENANTEGESWQSRVSVKPSEKLVIQLQQQQRQGQQQQEDVGSETSTTVEDHEDREQLRDREEDSRRTRTRREEVGGVRCWSETHTRL